MRKVDFENGRITQNILQTAFPMLVAQILNLLYSIVDRVYIGRIPGSGTTALGAVGLCFPIIIIINGFTNMFGMGGAPLFSMELGRAHRQKAETILNTAFRLLTVSALVITAAGELFAGPLLRLFGAAADELPLSLSYLRFYLIGTLPLMLSGGMNPYINGQGFALVGMISVTLGAVTNLVLDPVFIFSLGMGIQGAAVATVLSQILAAVVTMRFLLDRQREHRIRLFDRTPDGKRRFSLPYTRDIISLGLAPFIMQVTNSLVQIACNSVLMRFGGVLYVSVMTIVSSVRSILDVPVLAITEGTSPILSFNYGAKKSGNVRQGIRVMMCIAVPYTAITWLAIQLAPQMFIRIFSTDPEILADASRALHLYFGAFIFQSLQYSGQTVFKALNKRGHAIFFSLLRKAVLVVPLTYLLPQVIVYMAAGTKKFSLHPTDGVFLAEPVSNVVGGLACFITMLLTVLPELKQMEGGIKSR